MTVWLLNLDAERELARPEEAIDVFAALEKRPALLAALEPLVGNDRVLARGERVDARAPREPGLAWCPTPQALAALVRAGLTPPPAPSIAVIRRVNHRAFSARLGPTIEQARFVTDEEEALATIARPSPTGAWLLKRPLGFAGRGRAVIDAPPRPRDANRVEPGLLTDAVRRFIRTCVIDEGGVQIEPRVERLLDVSLHGWVDQRGEATMGDATVQVVTPHGAWCSTRLAEPEEVEADERSMLDAEGARVAHALAGAGYFGPFGIDAFRYLIDGKMKFQSRCEINARYTMGWALGMGDRRPDRNPTEPFFDGKESRM